MRIIKAENIKNEEMAKLIMDNMIPINKYLDQIGEDSWDYEDICFDVHMQFCEVLESLNLALMKMTNHNMAIADIMVLKMWDYLREKISFENLLIYLRKEYSKAD